VCTIGHSSSLLDQDSRRQVLERVGLLRSLILFGLIANIAYFLVVLWFLVGDPKLPDFIAVDRSILRAIAAVLLIWLSVACLQSVYLLSRAFKVRNALEKGRATDGVLLAQSWASLPVGMPACIVSEDATTNANKLQYVAVIPLDLSKFVQGLINVNSQATQSSELLVLVDAGSDKPLCLIGKEQSFIVCWSVPRWSVLQKIEG
jgi:hypothetical protein